MLFLLIDIAVSGFIEPLDSKDKPSKKGTLNQHILLRVIKNHINGTILLNPKNPGYSFISNTVWRRWYNIRQFFQCHNGTDMSQLQEHSEGVWIRKCFRIKDKPDLIIFFIPNIMLFSAEPYVYIEYLTTLHGLLLMQGFDNPAVFLTKVQRESEGWSYQYYLKSIIHIWIKITTLYPDAKFVLAGSSTSATLIISVLEHIASEANPTAKPYGAILISPIPMWHINNGRNASMSRKNSGDFMTASLLKKISSMCLSEEMSYEKFTNEIWKNAFPEGGIVLSYGSCEIDSPEIKQLAFELGKFGRVKSLEREDGIHCWPMISFLTEDAQDEKEDSCFVLAGIIARMIVWQMPAYMSPKLARNSMNVLTIDDSHI